MAANPGFLPPISLPQGRATGRPKLCHYPRCCAHPPNPSRRDFFKHIVHGTTAAILSTASPPSNAEEASQPVVSAPTARTKPRKVTWGYGAENGPTNWGTLSEDWTLCATGHSQSPIAISYREAIPAAEAPRPTLSTNPAKFVIRTREVAPGAANRSLVCEPYIPPPPPLVGDAPPVDTYKPPPPAAVVKIPDVATYVLRSFHFHAGSSEHVLDGNRGAMETHFIFEKRSRASQPQSNSSSPASPSPSPSTQTESGGTDAVVGPAPAEAADAPQVVVLGVMGLVAEKSDPWLEEIIQKIPIITAEDARPAGLVMDLDLGTVLPAFEYVNLYTYEGSLTTPPGTEGVFWIISGNRTHASEEDISALLSLQGGENIRPLQPLNDRKVWKYPSIPVSDDRRQ